MYYCKHITYVCIHVKLGFALVWGQGELAFFNPLQGVENVCCC